MKRFSIGQRFLILCFLLVCSVSCGDDEGLGLGVAGEGEEIVEEYDPREWSKAMCDNPGVRERNVETGEIELTSGYSCDLNVDGTLRVLNFHMWKACRENNVEYYEGSDNCIASKSYYYWFDDFYEVCVHSWDGIGKEYKEPLRCIIVTFEHVDMLREAAENRAAN